MKKTMQFFITLFSILLIGNGILHLINNSHIFYITLGICQIITGLYGAFLLIKKKV